MIRIKANDWSEYLFVVVAMCGECEKAELVSFSSNAPYMRKTLNTLISKKWIRQTKSEKGKIIRLTNRGYEILETLPPLKKHYDGLTNNNHKQNDPGTISRRKGIAKATCECIKAGYAVNNILIENEFQLGKKPAPAAVPDYKSIPLKVNEPIPTGLPNTKITFEKESDIREIKQDTIDSIASISEMNFITSNLIKALNRERGQMQMNRSRMRGALVGRNMIYSVYFQEGPLQFTRQNEVVVIDVLKQITQKAYGKEQSHAYFAENPKGEAVIFVKDQSDILHILDNKWIKGPKYLDDVYSHVYVIPDTDHLKRITQAGWKKSLLQKIYRRQEIEKVAQEGLTGYCDALIQNEMMSTEIITMDITKIKRTIRNLESKDSIRMHIICEESQVSLAQSIYENHKDQTIIEAVRI